MSKRQHKRLSQSWRKTIPEIYGGAGRHIYQCDTIKGKCNVPPSKRPKNCKGCPFT